MGNFLPPGGLKAGTAGSAVSSYNVSIILLSLFPPSFSLTVNVNSRTDVEVAGLIGIGEFVQGIVI